MNTARPGYSPPTRKNLGGELLDQVHEEVEESLYSQLNDCDCTLTLFMDGWSSVKNDPILASSVHTGKGTFLLQAMDSGAEKKLQNTVQRLCLHLSRKLKTSIINVCLPCVLIMRQK